MRSKGIIYGLGLTLMLVIPFVRYYVSTPGVNDCMITYVQNMEKSNYKGYIYKLDGGIYHIEPSNSGILKSIEKNKVGDVNGCFMNSGDYYSDLNNTVYCSFTYIINKTPIFHSVKSPLALMDKNPIDYF